MATVPRVSSAESLFDSNSAFVGEGIDGSHHSSLLPQVAHSSSSFQTSMCLDFQDKYGLERSLPSYSSSFQLAGSSSAWEHNDANSDTHFFTSNGNATTQGLTMQPHLTHSAGSSSQHEILNNVVMNGEWQQMGDMTAGFAVSLGSVMPVCSAPAMSDGAMRELMGRMEGGLCGSGAPSLKSPMRLSPTNVGSELGTPRGGWNPVDTGNHGRQGSSTTPHCSPRPSSDSGFVEGFIPFVNGNTSHLTQTFTFAGEGATHARSGVGMPLSQSDASKLPLLETKIEASVDTCGAKSMQDTSQAISESVGKEVTGRKRKTSSEDKLKDASCVTNTGVKNGDTEEVKGKRQKSGEGKEDAKQSKTERSSSDNSGSTSAKSVKENTKPPEPPKDYIHVRARRGQATDSHSLAERVRREKISERMKFLQDLVPGCNKVTGKAVMLDEIINYVQSLQRQVEFLSMKLAAVNPRLEFNMESLLTKEMVHGRGSPTSLVMGPQAVNSYTQQLHHSQHNALQAAGLDLRSLTSLQEAALRRGPLPCIEPYVDSVSQLFQTSSVWDGELQNLVHMMGFLENSHVQVHPCHLSTDQLKLKAEL